MYINTQEQIDIRETLKQLKKKESRSSKNILLGKKKLSGPATLKDKEMYLGTQPTKGIFAKKKLSARPKYTRRLAP